MTNFCSVCGEVVTPENLGALIPDDEYGMRAYCKKCKMTGFEDYSDWQVLR